MDDFENYEKLKELKDNFEQKSGLINKVLIQKEMVELLSQIIKVYSCSSSSPMSRFKWDLDLFVKNVPKFGQILSEILHNASKSVKYDGTTQLMALPVSLGEHLLGRLYTVVQMLNSSICQIGENVDFVITVENIVSQLPLVFSPRRKIMPTKVNSQLFKLLFSLAIRLSAQLESERLAEKYVNLFISANKCISISADDITNYW
ncbi:hypothetical protein niasHT_021041 [Heterodera trifolii]|uniref:Uncharacterized protein n=1 Tax=Heterodera trifolii TaxID=157864 RepID=A0ABD2KCT9_9BILA